MVRQLLGRGVVGIGVSIAAVGLSVSVVSAHVTIDTLGEVEQGSFAKIGLSVPNERDDVGTVLVQVQMPSDTPIPFVSVEPVPGWEITTTTTQLDPPFVLEDGDELTEAIETITWTATGDTQIGPGQFQEFWISAGPMPTGVDSLSFPAIQTYSSGEEVAWIDPPNPDGSEPDRPAPTLQLVAGTEGGSTETTVAVGSSDPRTRTTRPLRSRRRTTIPMRATRSRSLR